MNNLWRALGLRAIRGTLFTNFLWTLVALTLGYIVMHIGLENRMTDYVLKDLKENLSFIARPFEVSNKKALVTWCSNIEKNNGKRFSVIDDEGIVLCDNYADIESLVNHSDRPEFIDALKYGHGDSARSSSSIDKRMLYASVKLIDQNDLKPMVLRIALRQGELAYYLRKMRSLVVKNLLAVLLVLSTIFIWSSLRVGNPLRKLEKKLGQFKSIDPKHQNTVHETDNEWEKVDLTVDQIYKELDSKINEIASSNEKISTIVESIADGVLAIDRNEKIILANANFKQIFRVTNDNLTGKKLIDLVRNVDIRTVFTKVMTSNTSVVRKIVLENRDFELRVSPLQRHASHINGAVGIFHDVTEMHLLQRMREDFVTNVSHEVRTPLTALKGFSQIMSSLGPEDGPVYSEYAQKIEHNVNRLTTLFQDILSLSVLESREKIDQFFVDAAELVQNVYSNISINYANKKIRFHSDIVSKFLYVDPNLFEQILTNLLDNAYKYSPDESSVSVKIYDDQEYSYMEVIDSGVGIPDKALTRIFERFYRVDESRARAVGGTGLGLAIVKHAVQKHHGFVSVRNNKDSGSTFTVKIPRETN